MAQTMINFRMDAGLKKNMEETCKAMGLTMTAAFTAFAALLITLPFFSTLLSVMPIAVIETNTNRCFAALPNRDTFALSEQ